jgi:hypothetical protein
MKKILLIAVFATIVASAKSQTLYSVNGKEIIISYSREGSDKIILIKKIKKQDNILLYCFVEKLQNIARDKSCKEEDFLETELECEKIYMN